MHWESECLKRTDFAESAGPSILKNKNIKISLLKKCCLINFDV